MYTGGAKVTGLFLSCLTTDSSCRSSSLSDLCLVEDLFRSCGLLPNTVTVLPLPKAGSSDENTRVLLWRVGVSLLRLVVFGGRRDVGRPTPVN